MRDGLVKQGAESQTSTPEAFALYIKNETAKWAKIVHQTGLSAQ